MSKGQVVFDGSVAELEASAEVRTQYLEV